MARKIDIIQNPSDTGKNYVGARNAAAIGAARPVRYGFVYTLDPSIGKFEDSVTLPFPPESITIDEPGAANITYTQNSGKFVERRGNLSKTITLSGTTGYNYRPVLPTIVRQALPQSAIVAQEGPTSGMGRFLSLRNVFRKYWALFSDDTAVDKRKNAAMIFVNEKDDEYWVVEPVDFKMVRQAPRDKFIYRYEIVLQTISPLDNWSLPPDTLTLFQKVANVKQLIRNTADQLSTIGASLGNAMSATSGAIKEASDQLVSTVNTIASDLGAVADGTQSFVELPGLITGSAASSSESFNKSFENFLTISDDVEETSGTSPVPFEAHKAGADAAALLADLSGRTELFNSTLPDTWSEVLDNFDPAYGLGGFNQTLLTPLSRSGVREAEILPGDDLVNIAIRELGDAERFMEIAILNNLKPPYVSPRQNDRQANTLAPGDPILVPSTGAASAPLSPIRSTVFTDPTSSGAVVSSSSTVVTVLSVGRGFRDNQWAGFTAEIVDGLGEGQTRIVTANTVDTFTVDKPWDTNPDDTSVYRIYLKRLETFDRKSANDQLLGIDLLLDESGDLARSSSDDIDTVGGTDNMVQAIGSKLSIKPGELPAHPTFGLSADPGTRADVDSLLAYNVAVRQTLLSDRRIDDIRQVVLQTEKDKLELQAYVFLTGGSQPFAIDTRGGV